MNRCATPENIATGISSEAQRMRELEPLLSKADFHIDIHSTTKSPASMAIYTSKSQSLFGEVINADEHYIDLITLQVGRPLIDICERNGGIGIGLET